MPQTLYPRGTLKKIVKAHANRPLSKNVDILVHAFPTNTTTAKDQYLASYDSPLRSS
jgi:hypothetical protein